MSSGRNDPDFPREFLIRDRRLCYKKKKILTGEDPLEAVLGFVHLLRSHVVRLIQSGGQLLSTNYQAHSFSKEVSLLNTSDRCS